MAQVINTNIASLTAQRNLNNSQGDLQQALQRLSSGLRINSAKDDAAGLAIAERFTAQINGLNQATRNANDGVSFAQTAEGALGELSNIVQRIRELAVQSSNDTNSVSDRQALNDEVQELIKEADRIAQTTQFNGQNILDGSTENLVFQVGANQGQTIEVDGVDTRTSKLGALTRDAGGLGTAAAIFDAGGPGNTDGVLLTGSGTAGGLDATAAPKVEIGGREYTYVTAGDADVESGKFHTVDDLIDAVNLRTEDTGITAVKNSGLSVNIGQVAATGADLTINGEVFTLGTGAGEWATTEELAGAINDKQLQTGGVIAELDDAGNIILKSDGGAPIELNMNNTSPILSGFTAADVQDFTFEAGFKLQANGASEIDVDPSGLASNGENNFGQQVATTAGAAVATQPAEEADSTTLNLLSVATREDAQEAIATADYVLTQISSIRSELGAVQNRFETTISNLSVTAENLTTSRSRIQDADFAAETAALTRAQILQQAGTSVLAQANQLPQNVLSLLQS